MVTRNIASREKMTRRNHPDRACPEVLAVTLGVYCDDFISSHQLHAHLSLAHFADHVTLDTLFAKLPEDAFHVVAAGDDHVANALIENTIHLGLFKVAQSL